MIKGSYKTLLQEFVEIFQIHCQKITILNI